MIPTALAARNQSGNSLSSRRDGRKVDGQLIGRGQPHGTFGGRRLVEEDEVGVVAHSSVRAELEHHRIDGALFHADWCYRPLPTAAEREIVIGARYCALR